MDKQLEIPVTCSHSNYYINRPSFGEFIEKALHLVDADGQVSWVPQTLPLGYALEDVGEVVDQLGEGYGHPLVHFGRLWLVRGGGGLVPLSLSWSDTSSDFCEKY